MRDVAVLWQVAGMAANVTLGIMVEKPKLNIIASQCHSFCDEQ